ncbi:MAG: PHP domain-containing protein [Bacilli bacterium]
MIENENLIKEIIPTLHFKFPYSVTDYSKNLYVENYHYHTSFSNTATVDSPANTEDYAKRIIELNSKCIYSGEHGNQGNQFEIYGIAEKYGLKYVHSTEAYWVKDRKKDYVVGKNKNGENRIEKDKTNCHICIIGLTENAREDINYILSMANIDGYYYKPRIDLELLFTLNPKEIIITSACIAGWKYEDADDIWLKIASYFGNHFFFEVQNHNTDKQKELNKHILQLSKENDIQIICGLDSHYISYELDDIKRNQILKYKKIEYADENGWYLDYPNSKEIYNRFKKQGVLSDKEILTSMMNTNIFVTECNNIVFDKEFKIPIAYPKTTYDERVKIFKDILNEEYRKEPIRNEERKNGIIYEVTQIVDSGVVDYFLTNRKILKEAIENQGGILTTTSRGSMSSFYINKLLGFTTIDRFNSEIPIYPERFLTKERIQSGQMPDCDFNIAKQEPFLKASRIVIGEESCYPLMAIEKLKEKSAWQLYSGAKGISVDISNEISKCIDSYNDKKMYADEEDKEFIVIEDFIPSEYIQLYKESIEYQSIIINLKCHTCGHLLMEGDIRRKVGLISAVSETTKKRTLCACIEGSYLDDFKMVKNDFLIVDSVSLIEECFSSIGKKVPTFDELREMVNNDSLTWRVYEKGITCCINQCEKESTTNKVKKYKPKNLAELSAFIAGIRPGFSTLLSVFLNRETYTTGEISIDLLLEDSQHFLLYQEGIMKVLGFLGMLMGSTYDVIKSISKKKLKGEKKEKLQEQLNKGWLEKIGNLDNFSKVWNVIESSARYSFNAPHALSMAGDSAYLAWFKSHYTSKFYEVAINHYQLKNNKLKIDSLIKEANEFYGYEIGQYKFRDDNRKVNVNETNKIIYPNMSSIKDIQKIAPNILYDLKDKKFESLLELIDTISNTELNATSIGILIRLNYFSEFGEINNILCLTELYNKYYKSKQLKKEKLSQMENYIVRKCSDNETEKTFTKIDNIKLINRLYDVAKIEPTTTIDKIKYELILLGYTNIIDSDCNYFGVASLEKNQWGNTFLTLYEIRTGYVHTYKVSKKWYADYPCKQGDILDCAFEFKEKRKKIEENWINTGEYETILKLYSIID